MLHTSIDDNITVTSCRDGVLTTHTLSMRQRPEHLMGVREIQEPHFQEEALDYETFAGVTVMQMSLNHVALLASRGTIGGLKAQKNSHRAPGWRSGEVGSTRPSRHQGQRAQLLIGNKGNKIVHCHTQKQRVGSRLLFMVSNGNSSKRIASVHVDCQFVVTSGQREQKVVFCLQNKNRGCVEIVSG